MDKYEVGIQNRLPMGIAIGWTYYSPDEDCHYHELAVYLFLVSIIIRWI